MPFRRLALTLAMASSGLVAAVVPPFDAASAYGASAGGVIPLLRIGTNFPVPTLNPMTDGDNAWPIDELGLETLLKLGPDNQLEPDLATSVSQPNPVTYVYHLRRGVKFWDGDEMTASDVAFSLEQYRAPSSEYATDFVGVKDIAATAPYTVVVTLTQPDAAWADEPTQVPGVFEMKFYEAHKATFGNAGTSLMGTGPWEVDSFDPTTGADLSANPDWWGGKVPIQHVSIQLFSVETSLALAMRAGEIDLDPYVLDTTTFAKTSGAAIVAAPTDTAAVFSMNTEVAPWNDVHVRRAAAYALDRADIIAAAGGYNTPIYTYYPPSYLRQFASQSQVTALLNTLPVYRYDVAMAKAELAQSAYPHGFSTTLYEYNYGSSVDISEVVAAELQKVGINAHVQLAATNPAWEAAMSGPDIKRPTDFATGYCGGPDISSCNTRLGSWNTQQGEWNSADWAPPTVDNLLKQGLLVSNPARRFAVYAKILRAIQTDVPYVGLFQEGVGIALSPKFTFPGYASEPDLTELDDYALNIKLAAQRQGGSA
jgi:peptide/nickel transport system substrate-binding protein